jgi:CCR4-NOT transcription complex subunit 10
MEYLSCNYPKVLKMLAMAPKSPIVSESGECLAAFYFNNIGCLHYHMGKYNLAAHYLRKAIEENDAALNGYPPLDRGEKEGGITMPFLTITNSLSPSLCS